MPNQSTSSRIECACEQCGAIFHVTPSRFAAGRGRFCSKACHDASMVIPFETRLAAYDRSVYGCWLWTGGLSKSGYGQVTVNNRPYRAHRVAFEQAYGPIPDGMIIGHTCDNPACVRNDDEGVYWANGSWHPRRGHLWIGTPADNSADMVAKGRQAAGERHVSQQHPERVPRGDRSGPHMHPERMARGEANGFAKLTAEIVREIRTQHAGGASYARLAEEFNIGKSHVCRIVRRQAWQHVE